MIYTAAVSVKTTCIVCADSEYLHHFPSSIKSKEPPAVCLHECFDKEDIGYILEI